MFRAEGLRIAVVKANNHAELVPVTLGRDFGNEVEVLAGLNADDRIIQNPPDSLINDQVVRLSQPETGK
jgi:multidrug efflux pump subunit AcrA (membrane-fusion protein)